MGLRTTGEAAPPRPARAPRRRPRVLRLLMPLLLVCCGAWSVARISGADRLPPYDAPLSPLLAFTPYAALLSPLPAVYAAARRQWPMCVLAVAVTCAMAAAVLPRSVADLGSAANGRTVRLLTANLRFGHADPWTLVRYVRRSHVDVLSLQEFTPEAAVALRRAGLGTLLPYALTKPVPGALGSALYARYPIQALPMPDMAAVGQAMPRGRIMFPGHGTVEVMAVHLAKPLDPLGIAEWRRGLAALPAPAPAPDGTVRMLAGDFNGTLDNAPVRRLIAAGYADAADATGTGWVPTFQRSAYPPITIDHVFVDARCSVRHVAVLDLPHSDHRALFAEIRLP